MHVLPEIHEFLLCETPDSWVESALANQDILLIDHANCEKKAAGAALQLMHKYIERPELLHKMSRLAREEILHFEQVSKLMQKRNITYIHVTPSRYAQSLRKHVRSYEPAHLVDVLIIGALIEARSCERFAKIAPHLDQELAKFYRSLLKSEARHFQDYLILALEYTNEPIDERIAFLAEKERELIESPDPQFRFHSGVYTPSDANIAS